MRRYWRDNGLSIVLLVLFLAFMVGQAVAGHRTHNEEQREHGQSPITFATYLTSSHFAEATTENWESEFLQIFFYVVLTAFLFQRGSAESKDPDKLHEDVDVDPARVKVREDTPGPVRAGGLALTLYKYSLSLVFLLLFLGSLFAHGASGAREFNQEQAEHGSSASVSALAYMTTSRFWFESFQNWQSEFLALFSVVVLSIWLRHYGSPESKPVAAPHSKTGK
jgi:hypothetical protein